MHDPLFLVVIRQLLLGSMSRQLSAKQDQTDDISFRVGSACHLCRGRGWGRSLIPAGRCNRTNGRRYPPCRRASAVDTLQNSSNLILFADSRRRQRFDSGRPVGSRLFGRML